MTKDQIRRLAVRRQAELAVPSLPSAADRAHAAWRQRVGACNIGELPRRHPDPCPRWVRCWGKETHIEPHQLPRVSRHAMASLRALSGLKRRSTIVPWTIKEMDAGRITSRRRGVKTATQVLAAKGRSHRIPHRSEVAAMVAAMIASSKNQARTV